jgi:Lon protease-like protein
VGEGMSEDDLIEVYVFPLKDAVFFPNTAVPLNVFEPRFISMVKEALDTQTPVALCLSSFNWKRPKNQPLANRFKGSVTGIGHPVVLRENADGSMLILLEGIAKVELGEVVQESPFIICNAYVVEENDSVQAQNRFRFNRLRKNLEEWIRENIKEDYYRQVLLQNLRSPQQIVESLSMLLIKESTKRQEVLETNDINQKIEFMTKLLDKEWFNDNKKEVKKTAKKR